MIFLAHFLPSLSESLRFEFLRVRLGGIDLGDVRGAIPFQTTRRYGTNRRLNQFYLRKSIREQACLNPSLNQRAMLGLSVNQYGFFFQNAYVSRTQSQYPLDAPRSKIRLTYLGNVRTSGDNTTLMKLERFYGGGIVKNFIEIVVDL